MEAIVIAKLITILIITALTGCQSISRSNMQIQSTNKSENTQGSFDLNQFDYSNTQGGKEGVIAFNNGKNCFEELNANKLQITKIEDAHRATNLCLAMFKNSYERGNPLGAMVYGSLMHSMYFNAKSPFSKLKPNDARNKIVESLKFSAYFKGPDFEKSRFILTQLGENVPPAVFTFNKAIPIQSSTQAGSSSNSSDSLAIGGAALLQGISKGIENIQNNRETTTCTETAGVLTCHTIKGY